jgi:hypothetical protein
MHPFVPVHTGRALFMAHGDFWPFDAAFLNSVRSPNPKRYGRRSAPG